ncbi:acyl carrier protein [Hathewaya proteolytica DSM 3090]|uniref:Acyl carrier protein n=1 Tax=Hathewaya proteolytica DSM 3090 TaxID=1121331 RepID=A0A1M6NXY4_9CLOT|nr:acyl carrier protein [Hathewaya proteolytica]SHK00597.1 acyl carrier protein [Hathewaya proteolytica DSM 3090]
MEKIVYRIVNEFAEIGVGNIKRNTQLVADLGLSSLDIVEIVMRLEESFNIKISDKQISKFRTVGDIADYMKSLNLKYRF